MCKSLKATHAFDHKVKLTHLTAKKSKKIVFLVGEVMKKKYDCPYCSAEWVFSKVQYFRRLNV